MTRFPTLVAAACTAVSAAVADHVPLSFAPGEAYQFDWSHEVVLIDGATVKSRSRTSGSATRACPSCGPIHARRQEMVFDAHDRAFAFFKGACSAASTTT